jgi:hypothetical protein
VLLLRGVAVDYWIGLDAQIPDAKAAQQRHPQRSAYAPLNDEQEAAPALLWGPMTSAPHVPSPRSWKPCQSSGARPPRRPPRSWTSAGAPRPSVSPGLSPLAFCGRSP